MFYPIIACYRDDKDDGSSRKSGTPPPPEVDDEGYRIRPKVDNWDNDKNFYSSSDTDSGNLPLAALF